MKTGDHLDDGHEAGESGVVLGVDIGGTKVALMAHDGRTGTDLWRDRFGTPQPARPEDVLAEVWKRANELLDKGGGGMHRVRAIGVAVPGQVANGHVLGAGNLGWSHVPLRDLVRRQLDVPVFVEHDANAGALGESWRGAAQGMRDFVFLSVGTGLGAGVVLGGRIHRGVHHAAGEIGDMVPGRDSLRSVDPDAADFGAVLGARKLREIVDAAVQGMSVWDAVPESSHDERLHSFIEHLADHLAMTVINIGALLDPEAVVLGGGTMVSGEELLSRVRAHVDRWLVAPPRLLLSALGEDAQLHGVIHGAMEELRKSREGMEP